MRTGILLAAAGIACGGCASGAPGGDAADRTLDLPIRMEVRVEGEGAAVGVPCPVTVLLRNDSPDRTLGLTLAPPAFALHFEAEPGCAAARKRIGGPRWNPNIPLRPVEMKPGQTEEMRTYLDFDLLLTAPGEARLRCSLWSVLVEKSAAPDRGSAPRNAGEGEGRISAEFVVQVRALDERERQARLRPFLEALDAEEGDIEAAFALGCVAGGGDRALAERLAAHPRAEVRILGLTALDAIGEEWAVVGLRRLVHDPAPGVARVALESLHFGRTVLLSEEEILRVAGRPEEEVRTSLIDYLGRTRHPLRRALLARLRDDPAEHVRGLAARDLEEMDGE